MECSFCGSQSTTFKQGITKTGKNAGRPWKAYDCNEPRCINEKGYPNRTWVPIGNGSPRVSNAKIRPSGESSQTLESKVDQILAILKQNFPNKVTAPIEDFGQEETPF